ncbi:MAG: glycosyl hydrolase [Limisphaerales bacterium]
MNKLPRVLTGRILSATLALSFTMLLGAGAQVAPKGVGNYPRIPRAIANLADLHVGWYYDWGTAPVGAAPGIQFVPMIWGHNNVNQRNLGAAVTTGAGVLLGFNEPNESGQAHMTVEQAIADWPQLEATGLRLGSPATGTGDDTKTNGWLAQFMAQAKAHGYRVDFVCIHPYQANFDVAQATEDLRKEIAYVHDTYHLPIWVTEYAMVNWNTSAYPDAETAARFATSSAAMMQGLSYVERYAWYSLIPNQKTLSLANSDGSLNVIGQAWAGAAGSAGATINLVPKQPCAAPNYFCTWETQNYVSDPGLMLAVAIR